MSCLSAKLRARITAQITRKETLLDLAYAAYESAMADGDTAKYRLDTKEGEQEVQFRSPAILLKQIDSLESQIARLYRRLEGGGIVNMNLRRRRSR